MNPWAEDDDTWTARDDLMYALAVCDYWAQRNAEWIRLNQERDNT